MIQEEGMIKETTKKELREEEEMEEGEVGSEENYWSMQKLLIKSFWVYLSKDNKIMEKEFCAIHER